MTIASAIWIAQVSMMAKSARAERYFRVRRWVDRALAAYPKVLSTALWGPSCVAGFALIGAYNSGPVEPIAVALFWLLVMPLWAAWLVFIFWRASRLMKAGVIKSDRDYDQRAKYFLPPEYARSESVAAARRRKRRRERNRRHR